MHEKRPAVVLLSGGLDSTTVLAEAIHQGFEPHGLTILYGQRHQIEREAARRVARAWELEHHIELSVDLRAIGGSALTDTIEVPKDRDQETIGTGIPITYVPARNTIFLSLALGYAESINSFDIFIGVNHLDYSGYPDCRPEFLRSFEHLARYATKAGVERGPNALRIHAPLIEMTKEEIIRRGWELGVDFGITHSCYDPDAEGIACGRCDSCRLRLTAFEQAGSRDPIPYQAINRSSDQS